MSKRNKGYSQSFAPWRQGLIFGFALIGMGISGIFLAPSLLWKGTAACVIVLGFSFLTRAMVRWRGKWVEASATRSVNWPADWIVVKNKPVPGLGDADIFVTAPNGTSFVIEIKSYRGVKKAWFRDKLLKANGNAITPDPVIQARKLGDRLKAIPVIWVPEAQGWNINMVGSLLVVQGGGLVRALKRRA